MDEGILEVGHYDTPDPLAFFFEKHALEVLTQQTLDQILPKFIEARELSAAGGDGGEGELAARLNPFKRKTDLPVVYWSGIVDADSNSQTLSYPVPDYFNGSLRIMAVAVSADALGSKDTSTIIRGDFIINPNAPTVVAPGDVFDISCSVANNVKHSGLHSKVTVKLSTTPELDIIGDASPTIEISEGHEQTLHFKLRTTDNPGSATLSFTATSGDKSSHIDTTLSVRPANPFITNIKTGQSTQAKQSLNLIETLYSQYRQSDVALSNSPLVLVFGLQRYLDNFPFGCTEQLISKAMPLLALNNQAWFIHDHLEINKKMDATIQVLSLRQMSNGGFSYWPDAGENVGNSFYSVYAMHFLTEAKTQEFNVPDELFYNGINYLKTIVSQTPTDLESARIQAYAIYILTRNEIVTSNYLANLQLYLQHDSSKSWMQDMTAVYIAASYQILKSQTDANQLINQYQPQDDVVKPSNFYDKNIADAQYYYILAKHFPKRLNQLGDTLLMRLVDSINNDSINTVLSGYASLALGAYQQHSSDPFNLSITERLVNNQEKTIPATTAHYQTEKLGSDVKQINIINPDKQLYFYQLIQAGFDKTLPTTPLKQGMEIFREYRDGQGRVVESVKLGQEIEVHIQIRALDNQFYSNIAIEDLLPGGFEVVSDSVKNDVMEYSDVREDRVNFFGSIDANAKEIIYKIKAINTGQYAVPAIFAESMYIPTIKARGVSSKIIILE